MELKQIFITREKMLDIDKILPKSAHNKNSEICAETGSLRILSRHLFMRETLCVMREKCS